MRNFVVPGEFEEQESVLTVWPVVEWSAKGLEVDLVTTRMVKLLEGNVKVIIACYNEQVQERAIRKLLREGADISQIEFRIHKIDNPYPRDFGAEVLRDKEGNSKFADFVFTEYCFIPHDHSFSFGEGMRDFNKYHAHWAGISDSDSTWLASEGGDREFNGKGVMIAIEETEVVKRNPGKTKQEVEDEFKRILNLDKIIWVPRCTYDDENVLAGTIPSPNHLPAYRAATANGHIDEMCRFVSEDTILIAHITDEEAAESELARLNKERLDEAYKAVAKATDANGKPFRIVKMPMPEPIFIETSPGEEAYEGLRFFSDALGGKMLDGSIFPQEKIMVLPALSYCNFLITNNLVIAQKYWKEGLPVKIKEKDEEALSILKELFPDRKVVAIDTLALNLTGGGIHCHTRNIPR